MDINDLRIGVVVLRLANGREMSVRADDIKGVTRLSEENRIKRAQAVPRYLAAQHRATEMAMARLNEMNIYTRALAGGIMGGGQVGADAANRELNAIAADAVTVRLSFRADEITVLNAFEELEGWMRNS